MKGGDGDTPYASGHFPENPFVVTGLSVVRYVFDLVDWHNCRWSVSLGVSGHPGSIHYANQAPTGVEGELIPMLYNWNKIKNEAEAHQNLNPL